MSWQRVLASSFSGRMKRQWVYSLSVRPSFQLLDVDDAITDTSNDFSAACSCWAFQITRTLCTHWTRHYSP